jgi:SpoVK/Ycf46/Vps4 family AAA+-type ATPase
MPSDDVVDLLDAAVSSPSSGPILRSLARAAHHASGLKPVLDHIEGLQPIAFDHATRRLVAALLLREEHPRSVLAWAPEERAEDWILRTRALLALDQRNEAVTAYRRAVAIDAGASTEDLDRELTLRDQQSSTAQILNFERPSPIGVPGRNFPEAREQVRFKDVAGLEEVKTQIVRKIIRPFREKRLFDRFRRKAGGGVLLYGPPGCGKTLLARATAGECAARFFSVAIPDILDMYIGESEKRLANVFAEARTCRPAVLFFDEIEAIGAKRRFSESDSKASLVSTFLNEMDGVGANNEGILVLGATNVPWAVDPAFRRPGRFDRTVFVAPPDQVARRAILELSLRERPLSNDIDLNSIVQRTAGFSGADLVNLVETAADLAIEASVSEGDLCPIGSRELAKALREVKPSTSEWLTTARNYAKFSNESGLYNEVVAFLDRYSR